MKVLFLGASYIGCYAAVNFCKEHSFYFLSRTPGLYAHLNYLDSQTNSKQDSKLQIDCIINSIPPHATKKDQPPPYHDYVQRLLTQTKDLPYIYISSTAVFGYHFPSKSPLPIYNEHSKACPDTHRGELRRQMEIQIQATYPHAKILRCAGIYGPKRSIIEQFQAGNFSRAQLGNRLVSRIHVHDLLRLSLKLGLCPSSPDLVHGVDKKTAPYSEVFSFIEEEFGLDIPIKDWQNGPPKGKIIKSLYAAKLLGDSYRFPTYQEGFRTMLANQKVPGHTE